MANNFYILTGGPGAGKTTLIEALRKKGFQCVDEVGRQILKEQAEIGGNATHQGDRLAYLELMLERSISDFLAAPRAEAPVFFDRGLPGLIGYCQLIGENVPPHLQEAVKHYRYNAMVFLAPPWKKIYARDQERKQDFEEAIATYEAMAHCYPIQGYEPVVLPEASVADRVAFILAQISFG